MTLNIKYRISTIAKSVEKRTTGLSPLLKIKNVEQMRASIIWENSLRTESAQHLCTHYAILEPGKLPVTSIRAGQVQIFELKLPSFIPS